MKKQKKSIVTIGGGTGSFVVLSGLKNYEIDLNAVIAMTDSGGSTGKLRDQLGVLPPGDLRQALVALSEASDVWRKLFTYRFEAGDLEGHNFGNIFLSAIEKITESNQEAIDRAAEILQTSGRVIPITFDKCTLCAEYEDGSVIEGESNIDENDTLGVSIKRLFLKPSASINLEAKRVIERADAMVFGPGDLYTSLVPNLIVSGVGEIIHYVKAKKILVVNLMAKIGQTENFKVSDFINEVERYLGEGALNYVIVNSKNPSKDLVERYKDIDKANLIEDDVGGTYSRAKIIRADILSDDAYEKSSSDKVRRSLIRHDPDKLAKVIYKLVK
ncbi:YvcK family protein [Patescibacteria group bacterium]|nr:YvcK family protein [Patescibacteria group bacterium]